MLHIFRHHTEDIVLVSCSKIEEKDILEIKSRVPGLFRLHFGGKNPLFCPLCGEKLILSEETKKGERTAQSPQKSSENTKRLVELAIEKISKAYNETSAYDQAIPRYIALIGNALGGIFPKLEKLGDDLHIYYGETSAVAITELAQIITKKANVDHYHMTKGKFGDDKKMISEKLNVEDAFRRVAAYFSKLENLEEIHSEMKKQMLAVDQEITKKVGEGFTVDPVADLYAVCDLILNGKENVEQKKTINRKIGEHTLTLNYENPARTEKIARALVAGLILSYTQEMLSFEPIVKRLQIKAF